MPLAVRGRSPTGRPERRLAASSSASGALRVQLDDVAIRNAVLVPDLLSFESGLTPDACVSQ